VREFSTPPVRPSIDDANLTDAVVRNGEQHAKDIMFSAGPAHPESTLTFGGFLDRVRSVARALVDGGITKGDRVLIWSSNRLEWTIVDFALMYVGAVSVPLYPTLRDKHLAAIIDDCTPVALVYETAEQREACADYSLDKCWDIAQIATAGLVPDEAYLEETRSSVSRDDLATLIYTSGTTGVPKGCKITHGNLLDEVEGSVSVLRDLFRPGEAATLIVLPLAHVFARVVEIGAVAQRVRIGFARGMTHLGGEIHDFEPTFLLGVPRVFEALYNSAAQAAAADGHGRAFERATRIAIDYSRALETGKVSPSLRARHLWAERTVFAAMRRSLGGHCQAAVSGGAPLGGRLGHFYRGAGLPIYEGYGLTETTAAVTVNGPGNHRMGTVGRPLPGCRIRIAEDGEIVVSGPQVFGGYWHDDTDPTRDGWLHTGDIGEIDEEGFVRITGRQQEILVTAGGKTVAPAALEDRIRAHRLISNCLVVGDGRPYLGALITLEAEAVAEWGAEHALKPGPSLLSDQRLLDEIQSAVDTANQSVSQAEWVRRFVVLPEDWTEEAGHVTPSLKVRRASVLRDFKADVESMFV
jgi:long-chain acyl-CoA synthetase